ncbi:threonine dehydratase [Denitrobaculum tricleocarpae]|uniref:Threonine dehydratase n=1 Tax=Denitrobaculum tricleocarpae TaxID=2591009 RepID=A0A545TB70_9PROT|nr:threonine dehydratase [Denitrobaculum tricleocarpae]TQV74465.1 threonine dehydratase [Denitrobaculum tricleocarpae]
MKSISKEELEQAAALVHRAMLPTAAYAWPLLADAVGAEVWVKHENHTPTGAFKVRGGLVYLDRLKRERPRVKGIVSATRGNHGQSLAFAARAAGLPCSIFVPHGNSVEKNAAMRAFGADLRIQGQDFDEAKHHAAGLAQEMEYEFVPSYHRDLVTGVGTYALELFTAQSDLDAVYVPIGLGSGISGLIAARDALNLKTEIVGVVSEHADAYALSFEAGRPVATNSALTFADGMAVRTPDPDAVAVVCAGAARILRVSEIEIADAMRLYYTATHSIAEGAGAAPLAGLLQERSKMQGKKAGVILCGQNIDREWFATILDGGTPAVK